MDFGWDIGARAYCSSTSTSNSGSSFSYSSCYSSFPGNWSICDAITRNASVRREVRCVTISWRMVDNYSMVVSILRWLLGWFYMTDSVLRHMGVHQSYGCKWPLRRCIGWGRYGWNPLIPPTFRAGSWRGLHGQSSSRPFILSTSPRLF